MDQRGKTPALRFETKARNTYRPTPDRRTKGVVYLVNRGDLRLSRKNETRGYRRDLWVKIGRISLKIRTASVAGWAARVISRPTTRYEAPARMAWLGVAILRWSPESA